MGDVGRYNCMKVHNFCQTSILSEVHLVFFQMKRRAGTGEFASKLLNVQAYSFIHKQLECVIGSCIYLCTHAYIYVFNDLYTYFLSLLRNDVY